MSTLTADPGFTRGSVLGITVKMYEAENGDGTALMGVRKTFRDENPKTGALLSNHTVDCIAVKNTSGGALLPKAVVAINAARTSATGGATNASVLYGVVDEYLPPAGVADGEVFWAVVEGPTEANKTTGAALSAGVAVAASATAGSLAAGTGGGVTLAAAGSADTSVRLYAKTPLA